MAARFVSVDRETPMLLPPDLREWVPEDDLVHFVIAAVDRLPLEYFKVNWRGSGSAQHPPHMMLALLIYSYSMGIFSSRKIEQATHRDVGVRYLTGDTHPDHDTICKFRRENLDAFARAFVDVLELAREMGLLKVGKVSLDGSHFKADASIDQNVTYARATELRSQLEADIAELMKEAEGADLSEEDAERLPRELDRREKLHAKMEGAIAELESRAAARQQKAMGEYEKKLAAREKKEAETGKKPKGKAPQKPEIKAGEGAHKDEQCNLSDPDSRVMRKSKRSGFTQSHNAQSAVDVESHMVVGAHVVACASDGGQLEAGVRAVEEALGELPEAVLADAGYPEVEAFERLERAGVEVYCSVHREDAHSERHYDFRPSKKRKDPKEPKDPRLIAMRDKLRTEEGRKIYAKRNSTVETVFGMIKGAMGFRGFTMRGSAKVSGEWKLVCLTHNLRRLFNMVKVAA